MKPIIDTPFSTRHGIAACCVSTILLVLALPGGGSLWPLLGFCCVPFLVCINRGSYRQALFFGFFFGTVHFLVQLYWIVFVIGHYGGLPLYFSVPALLLLCFYLAIYLMLFAILARGTVARFSPFTSLWLIPAIWVAMDYLRSVVFSGFPWMDLGYGMASVSLLMQSADIWGHHGLTYLVVLLNTFFALCLLYKNELRHRRSMAVSVILLLVVTVSYSASRMQSIESQLAKADSLNVGVVQGNIDQGQKWNPARQGVTVKTYLEQSNLLMRSDMIPDLLLWPETALPFFPLGHPLLSPIAQFLQDEQVMLLAGSPWYERESLSEDSIKFYNSSLLFNARGQIVSRTSKSHLVPFGEYVPFKKFLPFIAPLVEGVGNFIPGEIANPPACKNGRIGVLICFESIFPDISRKWVDEGANLLVNITNDAWYGKSSAPYQTLAMTRLRAVETRRTIVRSANTGFSAFIDPLGRTGEESPLFVNWQNVDRVALMEQRTFFVRGGFAFPLVCLILTLIISVFVMRKR
jgi:apolipoprotein N-acyltransferase